MKIALINMPWSSIEVPSLALGLLTSAVKALAIYTALNDPEAKIIDTELGSLMRQTVNINASQPQRL